MTEKELETLFRKKLENRTVEFNPQSWEKMKPMLKDFKASPVWWKTRQAAIVSGIIGVSAAVYFSNQTSESSQALPLAKDIAVEQTMDGESTNVAKTLTTSPADIEKANANVSSTQVQSNEANEVSLAQELTEPSEGSLLNNHFEGSSKPVDNSLIANNNSLNVKATDNSLDDIKATSSSSNRYFNALFYDEVENPGNQVADLIIMPDMSDYDSEEEKPEDDIVISKPNSQKSRSTMQELVLLAGFNATAAYQSYALDNKSPGVSYFFGAEYNYYFSPRYSIKSGLNFASHAKVECLRIASEKTYDFGYTKVTEHVRTKNFQFIEIVYKFL